MEYGGKSSNTVKGQMNKGVFRMERELSGEKTGWEGFYSHMPEPDELTKRQILMKLRPLLQKLEEAKADRPPVKQ